MAPTITPYDFTNMTNSSSNAFVSFVQYTSTQTHYTPGLVILLSIFSVLFFSLLIRGYSVMKSIAACCMVNTVLAILLFPLMVISPQMLVISMALLPLSFLGLYLLEGGM